MRFAVRYLWRGETYRLGVDFKTRAEANDAVASLKAKKFHAWWGSHSLNARRIDLGHQPAPLRRRHAPLVGLHTGTRRAPMPATLRRAHERGLPSVGAWTR